MEFSTARPFFKIQFGTSVPEKEDATFVARRAWMSKLVWENRSRGDTLCEEFTLLMNSNAIGYLRIDEDDEFDFAGGFLFVDDSVGKEEFWKTLTSAPGLVPRVRQHLLVHQAAFEVIAVPGHSGRLYFTGDFLPGEALLEVCTALSLYE